jgi:hypothetical protein
MAKDGQAEGDLAVVADGNAGQRRLAGTDHVEPRGHQMSDVAQRRHGVGPVRIVGEYGPARAGARRRHHPVVAAEFALEVLAPHFGDQRRSVAVEAPGARSRSASNDTGALASR